MPCRLRVDWPTDRVGRTRHWPRFSWQLDPETEQRQGAFELSVWRDRIHSEISSDAPENQAILWSSGRVIGDSNSLDLGDDPGWPVGEVLRWSVRWAASAQGCWSPWALSKVLRLPLRHEADWGDAAWIASPEPWGKRVELSDADLGDWIWPETIRPGYTERVALCFEIDPQCPAVSGKVVMAVNDPTVCDAELKINDSRLPNFGYRTHGADPDGSNGLAVVEGEAATFLRPGQNLIWLNIRCDPTKGQPGVALKLDLVLADGRRRTVSTGEHWRWLKEGVTDVHHFTAPSRGGLNELEGEDLSILWARLYPAAPHVKLVDGPSKPLRRLWPTPHPVSRFRIEFEVDVPVSNGTLFLAARGMVQAYFDGDLITGRRLDPAPSNYDHTCWQTIIAIDMPLSAGRHTLGLELAGGFAGQDRVWVGGLPGMHAAPEGIAYGKPATRAVLHLAHADGSCTVVASGSHWKTSPGPIVSSNIYAGEHHNLATEIHQAAWSATGFADTEWSKTHILDLPKLDLPRQPIPPCRVNDEFSAATIERPAPGVQVIDFGHNVVGHAAVRVAGPLGTTVRVRYAERLHRDGGLDPLSTGVRATRVAQEDTFLLDRDSPTWLQPRFVYHGFRYAQVTADRPIAELKPSDTRAQVVHTDVAERGGFTCSDPTLNRYLAAARASYLGNLHGILTDCPHRERGAWHADIEAACAYGLYAFDTDALYQKTLQDTVGTLDEKGLPYYLSVGRRLHPPNEDIGWASVIAEVPWRQWRMRGDRSLLLMAFPHAVQAARWFVAKLRDGLLHEAAWGDHAAPTRDAYGRPLPACPKPLYASLKLYELLQRVQSIARILGDRKIQHEMAMDRYRLRRRLQHFVTSCRSTESVAAGLGHPVANAWALNSRLIPPPLRARMTRQLTAALAELGHINPGGFFGHSYVLRALYENRPATEAIRLLTNDAFPGIAWSLKHDDATTIDEYLMPQGSLAWRERSRNHPPFGGAASLLWSHLGGVRPGRTPRHILLRPRPDADLDEINVWHELPDGRVEIRLSKQNFNEFTLEVRVPSACSCALQLPRGWSLTSSSESYHCQLANGHHMIKRLDGDD